MLKLLAKLSIRAKILGTFIILVAAILVLLNQLLAPKSEDTITNIAELGQVTTRLLADKVGPAIDFGDTQSLAEDIQATANLQEIRYIAALDNAGDLLAESENRPEELHDIKHLKLHTGEARRVGNLLLVEREVVDQSDRRIGRIIAALSLQDVFDEQQRHSSAIGLGAIIAGVMAILVAFILTRFVLRPIEVMRRGVHRVAQGDLETPEVVVTSKDAIGELGSAINKMTHSLRKVSDENERERWLRNGQAELDEAMRGDLNVATLAGNIIDTLATHLGAQMGAFYLADDAGVFRRVADFAPTRQTEKQIGQPVGVGLVVQAARSGRTLCVSDVPEDYLEIASGLGSARPRCIIVTPVVMDKAVVGVIELASLAPMGDKEIAFIEQVAKGVAIAVNSAVNREQVQVLLAKTQQQSQALLKQQEQLTQANEDLKQKTTTLEQAKREIEHQSLAIQQASRYKSEFLANMSHELRSPLNAMLILAKNLSSEEAGNLRDDQREAAEIIHRGGSDLLTLINDILDLSKVEAGHLEVTLEQTEIGSVIGDLERLFAPIAREKGLDVDFGLDPDAPTHLVTDRIRLMQILKNLLSNAFKFTARGQVGLRVRRAGPNRVAFSVTDTGIGIPADKKEQIFQAFIQADGSTTRNYGGTGLGLAISQELTSLLGGAIELESELGRGCQFTLTLPVAQPETQASAEPPAADPPSAPPESRDTDSPPASTAPTPTEPPQPSAPQPSARDDTGRLAGRKVLLADADLRDAFSLSKVLRDAGLQVILAEDGQDALERLKGAPDVDLILIGVAGSEAGGLEVIEKIRSLPGLAQVPLIAMAAAATGPDPDRYLEAGASDVAPKPVDPASLRVLIERNLDGRDSDAGPVPPGSTLADTAS